MHKDAATRAFFLEQATQLKKKKLSRRQPTAKIAHVGNIVHATRQLKKITEKNNARNSIVEYLGTKYRLLHRKSKSG